jgi:putative ABC transport system permease protein
LLLVVVCLNVAVLVYTRTAMRQREIALRTALGAKRSRIVGQLFIEALVLSAVAALAGLGIAALALRQLTAASLHIASELPFWVSFRLSPEAALYAGGLSVFAAAIVGIVPALQATSRPVRSGMRLGMTWTILIVAQVAGAVALLPASVFNAWDGMRNGMAEPGFAATEYLSAQLENADRQTELMRRLEAEPLVSGVTFAMVNPGDEPGESIETEIGTAAHSVRFNRVDVNFFRIFDVPILAGRGFEPGDVAEGGAVLVNLPLAQRIFGGNALGRRIRYPGKRWYEIVGIVPDFPTGVSPGMRDSTLKVYHSAGAGQVQPAAIAIRMRSGAAATFTRRLQEIATALDPALQLRHIVGLDEVLRREQWIIRLEAAVFAAVTVSVLMLSSAGIYALMSFTVSQRRKEIAIRTALGADRKRIVAGIFSRALGQLAIGAALGMASGALIEKASGGNFMQGHAVVVLPGVGLFMMAVGFLATVGPARRSLRIEPTEALREQ